MKAVMEKSSHHQTTHHKQVGQEAVGLWDRRDVSPSPASLENSPVVAAQRVQIENTFGEAAQRQSLGEEEKPSQALSSIDRPGTPIGPAQEHQLPHRPWHAIQRQKGVGLNNDQRLELDASRMGTRAFALGRAAAQSQKLKPNLVGMHLPAIQNRETASVQATLQRWAVPAEDAAANQQITHLDSIRDGAIAQRDRARDLSTAVPPVLRTLWATPYIEAYQTADDLRNQTEAALRLAQPATRTLAELQNDVQTLGPRLNQLRTDLDAFSAGYNGFAPQIAQQAARYASLDQFLQEQEGAAKLGQWQSLASSIREMNLININTDLNGFSQNITADTFSEADVTGARLLAGGTQRKNAVIQVLTDLFVTGQLRLDTWSKTYPTAFDLRTGEFGAEWHVKCPTQSWLGRKWVFHAHCETIRDLSGNHTGFRFKNILGTNHLKMISERTAAGVQLDLPLPAATLAAMAVPYQAEFYTRFQEDSAFRAAIKKAR